jgi:DNA-binding transcriptional LysR family regulator
VLVSKAGAAQEILVKLLDAYAAEPGAVAVEVVLSGVGEQERLLRDGRADVALLHQPFDSTVGFDFEVLRTENQVLVLPGGHPLSTRTEVSMAEAADIPGLPLPRWKTRDGGYPDGPGPEVHDQTQLLQLVALGRTAVVLPESTRAELRGDLAVVPVVDAPQVRTVIAWPPHSRSRAVADLVRVASRV